MKSYEHIGRNDQLWPIDHGLDQEILKERLNVIESESTYISQG